MRQGLLAQLCPRKKDCKRHLTLVDAVNLTLRSANAKFDLASEAVLDEPFQEEESDTRATYATAPSHVSSKILLKHLIKLFLLYCWTGICYGCFDVGTNIVNINKN